MVAGGKLAMCVFALLSLSACVAGQDDLSQTLKPYPIEEGVYQIYQSDEDTPISGPNPMFRIFHVGDYNMVSQYYTKWQPPSLIAAFQTTIPNWYLIQLKDADNKRFLYFAAKKDTGDNIELYEFDEKYLAKYLLSTWDKSTSSIKGGMVAKSLTAVIQAGQGLGEGRHLKRVPDKPSVALSSGRADETSISGKTPDTRPKLYALLVGVTNYDDPGFNDIHLGARDAEGLAAALEQQKGGFYSDVQTRIIDFPTSDSVNSKGNGPPTRINVFEGLYWLKNVAQQNDLVIVYLSGHGYRDYTDPQERFWFLTKEANTEKLPTTAISGDEISKLISTFTADKKILFIDACHVGSDLTEGAKGAHSEVFPDMTKAVKEFAHAGSGTVVYAASQKTQFAFEGKDYSAFTEALIEAFGSGNGADASGQITTDLLDFYVEKRVSDLTKGRQHPVWNRGSVSDFLVALARH
jgi:uncharacterized caspase-like protein